MKLVFVDTKLLERRQILAVEGVFGRTQGRRVCANDFEILELGFDVVGDGRMEYVEVQNRANTNNVIGNRTRRNCQVDCADVGKGLLPRVWRQENGRIDIFLF